MLTDSFATRVTIRVVIQLLSNIGPCCSIYTAWSLLHGFATWQPPAIWQLWCGAEAIFHCFMLWYRIRLQREATHPTLPSREQRRALVAKVRREINSPENFLRGWFRGANVDDIGRDELKKFLDWAFWEGRSTSADDEEMEDYVDEVERMIGRPFQEGKGTAKSLRLTLDPIEMDTRSLFWYSLMMLADTVTACLLFKDGWQHHRFSLTQNTIFPPRPSTLLASGKSRGKNLSYWYKEHTSRTRLPVLYIHGIGIGLITQVKFLQELDHSLNGDRDLEEDGQVGILALEVLSISSRLTSPILHREEFLYQLTQILDAHGFDRFVLASHSYGTVLTTHILYHEPLASRIGKTLLVDPVSLLLHMPDVAYNFTARKPQRTQEWEMWYFASKDPGVAHTLGRHFFWSENVLWRDHIMELIKGGMNITVALAGQDLIVDTPAVARYLLRDEVGDPAVQEGGDGQMVQEFSKPRGDAWKQREWKGQGLDLLWWEELDHAQVFDAKETRARLVDVLVKYCKSR